MFFEDILEVIVVSASENILVLLDNVYAFSLRPSFFVFPPFF